MCSGEILDLILLGNVVVVFMMCGIDELLIFVLCFVVIEYGILCISGGCSDEVFVWVLSICNRVDICDDLYVINKGGFDEVLMIMVE